MTAPFCDASRAELVARVAYQLVVLQWKHTKEYQPTAGQTIRAVETLPFVRQSLDFRLALSSMYLVCVTEGRTSKQWLNAVVTAARSGQMFRAVFYPAYKAQRRDPRVTNRGVGNRHQSSAAQLNPPLGNEGKDGR